MWIDEKLSFKYHCAEIYKKLVATHAMIMRAKHCLPLKIRKLLYFALTHSYIDYCVLIWGGTKKSYLKPIMTIQKKIVRAVFKSKYNAHTEPLMGKLNTLYFSDNFKVRSLDFACKFLQGCAPRSLDSLLTLDQADRETRQSITSTLKIPYIKNATWDHLPSINIPRTWNNLDPDYRQEFDQKLTKKLKRELKTHYLTFTCLKQKCYTCSDQ